MSHRMHHLIAVDYHIGWVLLAGRAVLQQFPAYYIQLQEQLDVDLHDE